MKPFFKKIDGILLLDKPLHMTSNGALQRVRRLFNAKKAGHTGSLDPLATGMLPICFGEATKMSQFLLDSNKYYRVLAKAGIKTRTGDAEGDIIETRPVLNCNVETVTAVLARLTGLIQQVPPMFSALKHQGKPLYELARKGISIERKPREVMIHSTRLIGCEAETFAFDVHCSKGTYVRTLVEDMGEMLGCGAHVAGLHRTAVSPYEQDRMYSLEELEDRHAQYGSDGLMECLLNVDSAVLHLPAIRLSASGSFYIRTGQAVRVEALSGTGLVRLLSQEGAFMGIGEALPDGRVTPSRLVSAETLVQNESPRYNTRPGFIN